MVRGVRTITSSKLLLTIAKLSTLSHGIRSDSGDSLYARDPKGFCITSITIYYMRLVKSKYITFPLLIILLDVSIICLCKGYDESKTIASFGSIRLNTVTYFQCTFSNEGPEGYKPYQPWVTEEPSGYPCEKGTWHWVNCGEDWGTIRMVSDPAESDRYCVEMLLSVAGDRPLLNNQHVKLYECQGRDAVNYGEPYTTLKEAYYQMNYWFPSDFRVEPYSWRLIWQYCGEEGVYGNPDYTYSPQMALVFGDTWLYLQSDRYYYPDGQDRSFQLIRNVDLPKERWVPIVVFVKQGSGFRVEDGSVIVWIDGVKVFENHNFATATYSGTPYVIWSIANYGGQYEAQGQFVYIEDVTVTSEYTA